MTRQQWIVTLVGISLSLAAPACSKGKEDGGKKVDKPSAPAAQTAPAAKPAQPAPTPPAAKVAAPAAAPKAAPAAAAAGCAKLFAVSSKQIGIDKVGCIESTMEGLGHKFDSKACKGLENAWPVGLGNFAVLWASCQAEQKFDDAACNAVLTGCF